MENKHRFHTLYWRPWVFSFHTLSNLMRFNHKYMWPCLTVSIKTTVCSIVFSSFVTTVCQQAQVTVDLPIYQYADRFQNHLAVFLEFCFRSIINHFVLFYIIRVLLITRLFLFCAYDENYIQLWVRARIHLLVKIRWIMLYSTIILMILLRLFPS